MSAEGEIPQSDALSEAGAGAENLTELLSRDPETLSEDDFQREIEIMRLQAERWAEAERLGLTKRPQKAKEPPQTHVKVTKDLGL